MKRKELIALPALGVTEEIRGMAYKDTGRKETEQYYWRNETYIMHKHCVYLRAAVMEGIMKIEVYKGEDIRQCSEEPECMIFLSAKENKYITYLAKEQKWSSSRIKNLRYRNYDYKKKYQDYCWISGEERETVRNYLGSESAEIYEAVNRWQTRAKHQKEICEICRVMDQVTESPADFGRWVEEEAFWKKEYLFYNGAKREAYCTACKKTVKINIRSKHNEYVKCPECGRAVMAKSWKKQKTIWDEQKVVLIQKIPDGYIARGFYCMKHHEFKNKWRGEVMLYEMGRTLRNERMNIVREFEYGDFKQTGVSRWCKSGYINLNGRAVVYQKNLEEVFRGTKLQDIPYRYLFDRVKGHTVNIERMLRPDGILEYMIKSGLTRLSMDYLDSAWSIRKKQGTAQEILKIDGNRLNRLKQLNGGERILEWLQYEQKTGTKIRQDVLIRLDRERIRVGDLKEIMKYGISPERALNYIKKQKGGTAAVLTEWKDYLNMAKKERLDIEDDIMRLPKDLKRRHNELVDLANERKDRERLEEYKGIDRKIRKRIPEAARYYWEDKEYMIVPAAKCEELIKEGRALHHCVGASSNYMNKMAKGISWILFLRKKEDPDLPYYTLEIDMKTDEILQWYSEYDRKPDREKIQKVLNKYKKSLKRQQVTVKVAIGETA